MAAYSGMNSRHQKRRGETREGGLQTMIALLRSDYNVELLSSLRGWYNWKIPAFLSWLQQQPSGVISPVQLHQAGDADPGAVLGGPGDPPWPPILRPMFLPPPRLHWAMSEKSCLGSLPHLHKSRIRTWKSPLVLFSTTLIQCVFLGHCFKIPVSILYIYKIKSIVEYQSLNFVCKICAKISLRLLLSIVRILRTLYQNPQFYSVILIPVLHGSVSIIGNNFFVWNQC